MPHKRTLLVNLALLTTVLMLSGCPRSRAVSSGGEADGLDGGPRGEIADGWSAESQGGDGWVGLDGAPERVEPQEIAEDGVIDIPDLPPPLDVPTDLQPDLPDIPQPDVTPPPEGCCWSADDCPELDADFDWVCRGQGAGPWPEWGTCLPGADPGRCWEDVDCPPDQHCSSAIICPCGVDCDQGSMPGICAPNDGSCAVVEPYWVKEWCDAANVVIFDGQACVPTCFGCCWCEPFCEHVFDTAEVCEAACGVNQCAEWDGSCDDAVPDQPWWWFDGFACRPEGGCTCGGCPGVYATRQACEEACGCPRFVGALEDCSYQLVSPPESCDKATCMPLPCATDVDCVVSSQLGAGQSCVLGSCVHCAKDGDCPWGRVCRAGRCVVPEPAHCPEPPPCVAPGCSLYALSEQACPTCLCDTWFTETCDYDDQCPPPRGVGTARCVYGRCVQCKDDADCPVGDACLPPGMCFNMNPHPQALYGTWLVGWSGGMDHYSYVRFEPDGTVRRGCYTSEDGPWADDILLAYCAMDEYWHTCPIMGTWEPEMTASGFLIIRIELSTNCSSAGATARYMVTLSPSSSGGAMADFQDIDSDMQLMGFKVPTEACSADMSVCQSPGDLPMWP